MGVDEARAFLEANPGVEYLDAFIIDLCGRAVGKRHPAHQIEKLYSSGSQLCAGTYLLDVNGNTSDPLGYGFSDGDPDADSHPVPGTLCLAPWSQGKGAQCLLELKNEGTSDPVWFEPRAVLRSVVDGFAERGLTPVVAVELEFYLIDRERTENGAPQPPLNPRTGERSWKGNVFGLDELEDYRAFLTLMAEYCGAQNIPASTGISEYGPGQFEINLDHIDDPARAADQAACLRRTMTMAAREAGFDATFMSKPYPELAGSGMHIHMSILDGEGRNIFDPASEGGEGNLRNVIGGFQATMAEAFAIFAPNMNVFRRFEPDQFTPVTTDWGENNRSMAFRLPAADGPNRRVEHRVAGAEANPYLVLAAVLAGGLHGLENALEPTPMATGNAGAEVDETLPLKPWKAIEAIENAVILPQYLGEDYPRAYAAVKRGELDDFLSAITAREYEWYL
ncbi:MAG: glutamine synthetase family protein [Pseudomonadota bacterium]